MRILFLDDDRMRHDALDRELRGLRVDLLHSYLASHAVQLLGERFDLVCLDYHLEATGETGEIVAKHIATMPAELLPQRVILHTMARDGMVAMAKHLKGSPMWVRWMPFGPNFLTTVRLWGELA